MAKKKFKFKDNLTVILAIVLIIIAVAYYFYKDSSKTPDNGGTGGGNSVIIGTNVTPTGELNLHFIDIGQGDCIFIEFPDGNCMLIDSGDTKKANATKIVNYVSELGYQEITFLLATHSDKDHIGNMVDVFENFEVKYCFRPFVYSSNSNSSSFSEQFNPKAQVSNAFKCETATYYKFLNSLLNEGCGWEFVNKDSDFESTFNLNDQQLSYTFDFLSPTDDIPYVAYSDPNDYSPICILSYGEFEIMFTGDASTSVENEVIKYPEYSERFSKLDALKVGHHGSDTSTSQLLVDTIKPSYAIIQCGVDNKYNHPMQSVLTRLYNCGTLVYRTDLHGDVVLKVDAFGKPNFVAQNEVEQKYVYIGNDV